MGRNQTGLLIIRAWIEEDSAEPLRVQVRLTSDVSAGLESPMHLTKGAQVTDVVRDWLAAFEAGRDDLVSEAGDRPVTPWSRPTGDGGGESLEVTPMDKRTGKKIKTPHAAKSAAPATPSAAAEVALTKKPSK